MKHETEVYLAAWSRRVESSSGTTDGWVKFYLPDDDLLDKLSAFGDDAARGTKKAGGKLFKMILVEVDEIDEPVGVNLPKPLKLSQWAALLCKDPMFYEFLKGFHTPMIDLMRSSGVKFEPDIEKRCAQVIRFGCSVDSRSMLDDNALAAETFNDAFYNPFKQYKEGKQ